MIHMQNSWLAFDQLMEWALRLSLWRRRRFQISWWTRTSWCFNHTMLSVGQSHAAFNNFLVFGIPTCPILDQKTLDDLSVSIWPLQLRSSERTSTTSLQMLAAWWPAWVQMPVLWCTGSRFKPLSWSWSLKICAPGQERLLRKFKDKNAYEIPAGDHGSVTVRVSKVLQMNNDEDRNGK